MNTIKKSMLLLLCLAVLTGGGLFTASPAAQAAEYPAWHASTIYTGGEIVSYSGKLWQAQWWTQNQVPGADPWGPWRDVSEDFGQSTGDDGNNDDDPGNSSSSHPAWDPYTIYNTGDIVTHNGHLWRAKWWTQNQEPGTTGQWGVWELVGVGGDPPDPLPDVLDPTDPGPNPHDPVEPGDPSIGFYINATTLT